MLSDPTFWVLVAFVLFIAALAKPAFGLITKGLDQRAERIRTDIEEAEALLKESQDLLATYQKKQRDAVREAEDIIAQAEQESMRLVEYGRERLEVTLARREQLAIERIGRAEAAALDEVRNHTINIAVEATRDLLANKVSAKKADAMVDAAIKELPDNLH